MTARTNLNPTHRVHAAATDRAVASAETVSKVSFEAEPFDTECLGAPVARLFIESNDVANLGKRLAEMVADWRRGGVWLVSCRVPVSWTACGSLLDGLGFRAVETLITFQRPVGPVPSREHGVRVADDSDRDACEAIGRNEFSYDRFHADSRIDNARADELKAAWVKNAFTGRADTVLVSHEANAIAGFVICQKNDDEAIIDLIAVADRFRGRDHGRALVAGALAHYSGTAPMLRVATQAANSPSVALYDGLGFTRIAAQTTFHWINEDARP